MSNETFTLTLHESKIDKNFLDQLKKIFLSYPGESSVNLKITSNSMNYKILELKSIKVDPNIIFLNAVISIL